MFGFVLQCAFVIKEGGCDAVALSCLLPDVFETPTQAMDAMDACANKADARFGDDIRWQDEDVCRYAGLTTQKKDGVVSVEPRRLEHEDDIDNAYHSLHNTAFLEFAEEENGHHCDMQMVEVGACWTRRELSAAEFIAILLPAEDEHGLPTRDVFSPYVFNAKPSGLEGGM